MPIKIAKRKTKTKKQKTGIHKNMEESQIYYAKQKKLNSKDYLLYSFTYVAFWKSLN